MKLQPEVPRTAANAMLDAKRALRTSNFPPDEYPLILPAEKIEPVVNWLFAKGKLSMTITHEFKAGIATVFRDGKKVIEYKKGMTIVYPHHGAAHILDIKKRLVRGENKLSLNLLVEQGNLEIWVPVENSIDSQDGVGIRLVIDAKGVRQVEKVLKEPFIEEPTNWSRRFKANQEKLGSGDVMKVSEIVRDLWRRQQDRGLSAGEKRMLSKAMQILASELALALSVDEAGAQVHIEKVLAKGSL